MWLFGISQSIFANPLFAGRLVSVGLGGLTALGIYLFAKKLFDNKTAYLSLIIYLTSHYFFFFNRQALIEAGLATIFVWTGYMLFTINKLSVKKSVLLGILFGLGYLTKSNALLVILVSCLILAIKHQHEIKENFGRSILIVSIIFVVGLVINLPMIMHPWFSKYIHLSTQYTFSMTELFKLPGKEWLENLSANSSILLWFITPMTLVLAILGIKQSKKYALAMWILLPILIQIIIARFLVSRYLVAYLPLIVVFASFTLTRIKSSLIKTIFGFLIFIPNLYLIALLFTSPPSYFLALKRVTNYSYEGGYVTAEASGYNTLEALKYFDSLAIKEPILLGLGLFSGNPEASLLVYYRNNPRIKVAYLDGQLFGDKLTDVDCLKFDRPTYLTTRDKNGAGMIKYFEPLTTITNNYSDAKLYVFKLKENCQGKSLMLSSDLSP